MGIINEYDAALRKTLRISTMCAHALSGVIVAPDLLEKTINT
jgi:hypothetical protein